MVPEPSHFPTLHDTQLHDDLVLHSIPSSPLSVGFPPSLTEPDFPDTVITRPLPDSHQDSHLPESSTESAAISDTESPRRSPSPFHLSLLDACGLPEVARLGDDSSPPTLPVSFLRDIGEPNSPQSAHSLLSETPSVTEVDMAATIQSSAGEPLPGEIRDTRHQEPPFMTDGRGRVVWSCSVAKRGSSPLAVRSQ
ncbi:hypothetical protein EI94DRAFT_1724436 [Lactarius quietus]|nr:hypothetical protein EI94DRAFT_1724436 [Lactarius quietus]